MSTTTLYNSTSEGIPLTGDDGNSYFIAAFNSTTFPTTFNTHPTPPGIRPATSAANAQVIIAEPSNKAVTVDGVFTSTSNSISFSPVGGRAFNITIWGEFAATIVLVRSFDGGASWHKITVAGAVLYTWTDDASEMAQEDEESVLYRLECIWVNGIVNYRISQ